PVLDAVGLMEDVGRHPFLVHGHIQLVGPLRVRGGGISGWYRDAGSPLECVTPRGCRLVVRHELPKLGTRVRFPSPAPALPPTPASGGGTFPQLRRGTNPEKTNSERGFGSLHRSLRPLARRRGGLILGKVLVV